MTKLCYLQKWLLGLSLGLLAVPLHAQVEAEDLPPVSRSYVLTNVFLHPQPGELIEGATVLIEDGLITAVGTDVRIPGEATRVEADSLHVYAGFIDGLSQLGIKEKKDEDRERPDDPGNPPPAQAGIQPQRLALDLMDASSSDI
mgnify:FL=1